MTRGSDHRAAFTLLELLVVLAVLALIAATASLKIGGVYQQARLKQAEAAVASLDGRVRRFAHACQTSCEIRAAVGSRRLWVKPSAESEHDWPTVSLPESTTIARVITPREDRESGEVAVRIDRAGQGESYALLLTSPGGRARWLVFAGLTGQRVACQDEDQIEELFRAIEKNRFDPD